MPKTYRIGADVYDIPDDEVSSFLQDNPQAQETKSFVVDNDTFDIPISEAGQFVKDMPPAKSLEVKKKEESVSDGPSTSDDEGFRTVASPEDYSTNSKVKSIVENPFDGVSNVEGTNIEDKPILNTQLAQAKQRAVLEAAEQGDTSEIGLDAEPQGTISQMDMPAAIDDPFPDTVFDEYLSLDPTRLQYITGKAYNQSAIGLADAIYNKEYRIPQEYLERYDANMLEDVTATAFSFLLDAPLLGAGGKIGSAVAKPVVNKVVSTGTKKLVNQGIKKELAEQIVRGGAKKTINAINSAAASSGALGFYDFTKDALEQWANPENNFSDVEWGQSLASGGKGALLGAGVGLVGEAFAPLRGAANNLNSQTGRVLGRLGIVPAEILAENTLFTYGGALLDGRSPNEVTGKEFVEGALMLTVLKGQGALTGKGIKEFKESTKFKEDKAGEGVFEVNFTRDELDRLGYKDYESAIKDLSKSSKELVDVLQDKNVPALTKSKVLWGAKGIKWDADLYVDKVEVKGSTVEAYNKNDVLIYREIHTSPEEAQRVGLDTQMRVDDNKKQMEIAGLSTQDKSKLISGVDEGINNVESALNKPPTKRTKEEKKIVKSFYKEADEVIKEKTPEKAEKEAPKPTKPEKDTKVPPKEEKALETPIRETEKPVSETKETETPKKVQEESKKETKVSEIDTKVEKLPDNVIKTKDGLFELNEGQAEQFAEMKKKVWRRKSY